MYNTPAKRHCPRDACAVDGAVDTGALLYVAPGLHILLKIFGFMVHVNTHISSMLYMRTYIYIGGIHIYIY